MNYDLEILVKQIALLQWLGDTSPEVALTVHNTVKNIIMLAKAQGKEEAIKEMSERTYTQFPNPNTYPTRANAIAEAGGDAYSAMLLNDTNEFNVNA